MKGVRTLILGLVAMLFAGIGGLTACQRQLLYHPSTELIAPSDPAISVERIRTSDGQNLIAWYRPAPKGAPVFLYFDGNGGRPEAWGARWQRIAEGGAGFLAVYYRGYSGSSGHPTEAGLHEDARAGYDWLIARGYRPRDIVIDGFSLGSGVAVRLASERAARALILEAPFTSTADVAARAYPFVPVHLLMWDQFRSRDYIAHVRMPVLIAHGDRDTVVPFAQGEELFRLAGSPKALVRMPGSSHVSLVRDGIYAHIWAFLAQHPA